MREDRHLLDAVAAYAAKKQYTQFEHSREAKNSAGELMIITVTGRLVPREEPYPVYDQVHDFHMPD